MDEHRDQAFAAWVEAERLAYEAVHQLHQRTQGGRIAPTPEAIAAVLAVRRQANHQLAQLSNRYPVAARPSRLSRLARTLAQRGGSTSRPATSSLPTPRIAGVPQIAV